MLKFSFLVLSCLVIQVVWTQENPSDGSPCYAKQGGLGICVSSEECDPQTGALAEDGSNIINQRKSKSIIVCPSPLVCCYTTVPEARAAMQTAPVAMDAVPASPISRTGCGWLREGEGPSTPGLARKNEIPWSVGIFKLVSVASNGARAMAYITNGALIHQRAVLTVAHSFQPDDTELYASLGDYDQFKAADRKALYVQEMIMHEEFNRSTAANDFALLILAGSATESLTFVAPICLPTLGYQPPPARRCFFTGWGNGTSNGIYHSVLTKTHVPIVSNQDCETKMQPSLGRYYKVQQSLMCAGGEESQDVCMGAGGSPLVCPIEDQIGRYILVGEVVYVTACGNNGLPAVFSNVGSIRPWIEERLAAKALTLPTY